MRIDLSQLSSDRVGSERGTNHVSQKPVGSVGSTESEDRTTFTSDSSSVGSLVGKAMSSPEIRQDLVAQLKQSVSSGQYTIDVNAIASSMIDQHA